MYSKYIAYQLVEDFEIICLLDGDDWLSNSNVLDKLESVYSDPNIHIVTSDYETYYNGSILEHTYKKQYSDYVVDNKNIRYDESWCLYHLKTGYGFLFKSIPKSYLQYQGEWLHYSTDMAEMYCVIELCQGKHIILTDILYVYNKDNSILYETSYYNSYDNPVRIQINKHIKSLPKCTYELPYTYVINMAKDTIKKENMEDQLAFQSNKNFKFIVGVDGKNSPTTIGFMEKYYEYMGVKSNSELVSIKKSTMMEKYKHKYNYSRQHITNGSLGLIQSVFLLLTDFLNNPDIDHALIFEDDVFTLEDFKSNLMINAKLISDKDLIYLGCHTSPKFTIYENINSSIFIDVSNFSELIYGTYAMIISKRLASRVLEIGIDNILKLNLSWDLLLNYIRNTESDKFKFVLYFKQLFVPNVMNVGGVNKFRNINFYTERSMNLEDYHISSRLDSKNIEDIVNFIVENREDSYFNTAIEKVVYINLESRLDRKIHTEDELSQFFKKNKIIRFNAIKHEKGAIGCGLSHIAVLELAIKENWRNVLIVEDDITFIDDIEPGTYALQKLLSTSFDAIVLGGSYTTSYKNSFKLIKCQCALAYIVNNHYYTTLLKCFKDAVNNLSKEYNQPKYAIDVAWHKLQKCDNWYIIKPNMCIQMPSISDINNSFANYMDDFTLYNKEVYTFHVLITSTGNPILQKILDSLVDQLYSEDCVTIVYDGCYKIPLFDLTKFKCKINQFYEPTLLGYGGKKIRNKYANILEQRTFVLHANETDIYNNNAFVNIRDKCQDPKTLYMFKLVNKSNPDSEKSGVTQHSIIPYELNKRGLWLYKDKGEDIFYEQIIQEASTVVKIDHIIYMIRTEVVSNTAKNIINSVV
jgi:glycosyl transferase family 25